MKIMCFYFKKYLHVPMLYLLRYKILYILVTHLSLFFLSSQSKYETYKPQVGLQDFIQLLAAIRQSSFGIYANTKRDLASFYTTEN